MAEPNKPHQKIEKDSVSGVDTTGHEWDGIKELNNPAPRWWLLVFVICCLWAVGYWVLYPAWPTFANATKGVWEWTSRKELAQSQDEILKRRGVYAQKIKEADVEAIRNDPELFEYARLAGSAAFKQHCSTCHGSGAQGIKGYPNLNDDDWLWGGKIADIYQTLRYGIRSAHNDTHISMMPAFGKDGILKKDEISELADFVGAIREKGTGGDSRAATLFAENCASCHGANGEGMREVGAPALNDVIWLYGGDKKTLEETISKARAGVMPAWEGRLDDATIKALTVYVHSLGGGE